MRRLIASVVIASVALVAVLVAGCGADKRDHAAAPNARMPDGVKQKRGEAEKGELAAARHGAQMGADADKGGDQRKDPEQQKPANFERKIVYTGSISLIVEDFDKGRTLLLAHAKEYDGYVANSDEKAYPGQSRQGTWTVRIPVARSDEFREEIGKLGELRSSTLDSRDITDEYHDTKNTIKNLEKRQDKLREMYNEKKLVSDLSRVLELDRELASVSTQIDVRKGQVQRWDKETAFATYTVTLYDRRGYVPPQSPEFTSTIGRTWSGSLEALSSFGKGIVLVVVAVAPWLPVMALVVVPVWLLWRRQARRSPPPLAQEDERQPPRRPRREDEREPRRPQRERREDEAERLPTLEVVEESAPQQPPPEQRVTEPRREGPEGE